MSWWCWNVNPKLPTAADIEAVRRQIRGAVLAEEKLHPSCMWDWISPARVKMPYAE